MFREQGGNIGRAEDNDWVLSDPELSRIHAVVTYENGDYLLTDHSTNGTFVNDSQARLDPGEPHRILDGDVFLIGSFEVVANLVAADSQPHQASLVGGENTGLPLQADQPVTGFGEPRDGANECGDLPAMDDWLGDSKRPSWFPVGEEDASGVFRDKSPGRREPEERPPVPILERHLAQPVPRAAPAKEPEDGVQKRRSPDQHVAGTGVPTGYIPGGAKFHDFTDDGLLPGSAEADDPFASGGLEQEIAAGRSAGGGEVPVPGGGSAGDQQPPPQATEAPVTTPSGVMQSLDQAGISTGAAVAWDQVQLDLLAALLRGLGSPGLQVHPEEATEFVTQIGQLVHEAVQGLIDTLRLRDEFKREFYVPVTRIAPTENNVFKHSANAEDALSRAFSGNGSAYIGPVESTRQGFQDIAAHHLALVAGMQAAVRSLLDRFSPLALEERIGKATVLEGVLPQIRKAQMWEQFEKEYARIKEQAEEDFQQVFGQCFERAYTQQILRLRSAGFGGGQNSES